jgi:alkylation response protein AidB-like acyl-CoA dehydrogenase
MDFEFTEEQDLLRDSVRKFVEKDYPFDKRAKLMESELGFSKEVWKGFADLGWTALPFSEEDGGIGGTAIDTMIICEELGKGLVLEPYWASIVFAGGILRRATAAQRARHLPALIGGEITAAVAYAEPESRFDLARVSTVAKKDGAGFVLHGKKIAVVNGHAAELIIVSARTSGAGKDGITLFAIDGKAAGLKKVGFRTVDGLHAAHLSLEGVKVSADQIVGELDKGYALLEQAADEAIVGLGAEAVGVMEILVKHTVEYTKERKQFGVPIASFQVLQHRMVDMYMEHEQSKSMLFMAAMTQESGRPIQRAASALKVQIGKSGRIVGQSAIQNHGGMGMTDELAVSHYFKRITMIDLFLGNVDHHIERYRLTAAE